MALYKCHLAIDSFLEKLLVINTERISIEKTRKVTGMNGTKNYKLSRQYKGLAYS